MSGSFELYDDGPPPTAEPPVEEPGESGDDSGLPFYVMHFHRSTPGEPGEEVPVEDGRVPLVTLDGIDPDELARNLIPTYEDAGWVFDHLSVTTQHVETYDPRN